MVLADPSRLLLKAILDGDEKERTSATDLQFAYLQSAKSDWLCNTPQWVFQSTFSDTELSERLSIRQLRYCARRHSRSKHVTEILFTNQPVCESSLTRKRTDFPTVTGCADDTPIKHPSPTQYGLQFHQYVRNSSAIGKPCCLQLQAAVNTTSIVREDCRHIHSGLETYRTQLRRSYAQQNPKGPCLSSEGEVFRKSHSLTPLEATPPRSLLSNFGPPMSSVHLRQRTRRHSSRQQQKRKQTCATKLLMQTLHSWISTTCRTMLQPWQ